MTRNQEFSLLLRKLQFTNRFTLCTAIKDIAAALQESNKSDVQELLELLISTHETDIQIKLLSVLAAYIMNNGVNYEVIVKYNPLYDTIQTLLVRGLPMKASVVLNFVMALLSCDDGDARSPSTYARNMIRVSGCLNTMSDMFSGSMMYQDTWVALCQSLAEACRGSEINQNYSSHLVPLCVQRSRQGNMDVCAVLQSLLHNHERNIQLFIDSDGLNIFTRQLLQYNMGMQLLNTIVEKSPVAVSTLRTTDVVFHLRDFLHLYGPYSQLGQWATIILYHLDKGENSNLETSNLPIENMITEHLSKVQLHKENFNKQTYNNVPDLDDKALDQRSSVNNINKNNDSRTEHISENDNQMTKQDDTASLFTNVIKEVLYWKSKEENKNTYGQYNFDFDKNFACDQAMGKVPTPYIQNSQNPTQNSYRGKQNIRTKTYENDLNKHNYNDLELDDKALDKSSKVIHILNKNTDSRTEQIPKNDNQMTKQDDTATLFAKVIKEVRYWKSKEENRNTNGQYDFDLAQKYARDRVMGKESTPFVQNSQKLTQNSYRGIPKQNIRTGTYEKDLSFSFLMNQPIQDPSKQYRNTRNYKLIESFSTPSNTYTGNSVTSCDREVQTNNSIFCNTGFYKEKIDLKNFRPPFISTPKRDKMFRKNLSKMTHKSRASSTYSIKSMRQLNKPRHSDNSKQEKSQSANREVKHRSMSERFFSAINESCTTIVKSMKSIFKSKQGNDEKNYITSGSNKNEAGNESCSYSFTNYMRKRDAHLEGESSHHDSSSSGNYKVDSCKTCRDTIVLQHKMKRDDRLKLTVRKLKMGINLYGCDFKKISNAMWPHDRYMTPEMLHNLYRKLIVKGGHDNHSFRYRGKSNYAPRKR